MPRSPDQRYLEVEALVDENLPAPADERMAALYDLLRGKTDVSPFVVDAYDLYKVEEHRGVVDAFLLSKAQPQHVLAAIGIGSGVLDTYAYLFMDVTVFRNKLELMTYAAGYEGTDYSKELVRTSVSVGSSYLLWAYGQGTEVEPRDVIKKTMVDSFYRGMAHKTNTLTSAVSKEAHKWWTTAIKNAEIMEAIDPQTEKNAENELGIALYAEDNTVSIEASPVPVADLLH